MNATRTAIAFRTDRFNLTEQKPTFVNPDCFGDDLGEWLIGELQAAGHTTASAPGAEDFGWYVDFTVDGQPLCAVIGHVPDECWFIVVEAKRGLLGSMLGGRNRNVPLPGARAIHEAVQRIPDVNNIRWFTWAEFRSGKWVDSRGATAPDAP